MDYTGCDGKRYTADMFTPIGIGAKNANDLLSFASSYSNELNLEHTFIFPSSDLLNVQSVIGVRDVMIVSDKLQSAQTLTANDSLIVYLAHLKKTIDNNPLCGECYTELASLLMKIKRYDEAANYYQMKIDSVSAPKNPTGEKYKIINFNPVYEKVKIYRESDYESSQGV
jgi:tetratricopeptide (TPR) repeat protein